MQRMYMTETFSDPVISTFVSNSTDSMSRHSVECTEQQISGTVHEVLIARTVTATGVQTDNTYISLSIRI